MTGRGYVVLLVAEIMSRVTSRDCSGSGRGVNVCARTLIFCLHSAGNDEEMLTEQDLGEEDAARKHDPDRRSHFTAGFAAGVSHCEASQPTPTKLQPKDSLVCSKDSRYCPKWMVEDQALGCFQGATSSEFSQSTRCKMLRHGAAKALHSLGFCSTPHCFDKKGPEVKKLALTHLFGKCVSRDVLKSVTDGLSHPDSTRNATALIACPGECLSPQGECGCHDGKYMPVTSKTQLANIYKVVEMGFDSMLKLSKLICSGGAETDLGESRGGLAGLATKFKTVLSKHGKRAKGTAAPSTSPPSLASKKKAKKEETSSSFSKTLPQARNIVETVKPMVKQSGSPFLWPLVETMLTGKKVGMDAVLRAVLHTIDERVLPGMVSKMCSVMGNVIGTSDDAMVKPAVKLESNPHEMWLSRASTRFWKASSSNKTQISCSPDEKPFTEEFTNLWFANMPSTYGCSKAIPDLADGKAKWAQIDDATPECTIRLRFDVSVCDTCCCEVFAAPLIVFPSVMRPESFYCREEYSRLT